MNKLEDRRLPDDLKLKIRDSFLPEKKAIIRFANGDLDMDDFIAELEKARLEEERTATPGPA
ncbi:MAG: hypothetical protein HY093_03075 [Candidatus Liptonbacteria bacterium]|nr:hypothetical protein [Candidatus Liptonbacteria bacterium]